jgi:Beta-lactamase
MERRHLVGAVVVVVDREGVIFAEGYGHADLEQQTPVRPESTTFQVASVSKLLTTTAPTRCLRSISSGTTRARSRWRTAGSRPDRISAEALLEVARAATSRTARTRRRRSIDESVSRRPPQVNPARDPGASSTRTW